jgi:hypothetical protein
MEHLVGRRYLLYTHKPLIVNRQYMNPLLMLFVTADNDSLFASTRTALAKRRFAFQGGMIDIEQVPGGIRHAIIFS